MTYEITALEPVNKKKYRLFLDGSCVCFVYASEIRQFGLKAGASITQEQFTAIMNDCVCYHAKRKAMELLKHADRTEQELRQRLIQEEFPPEAAEIALDYVKSYGYVNDASYAERYIMFAREKKSIRQIQRELRKKGIEDSLIQMALEEAELDDREPLRLLVEKKTHGQKPEDEKERQKLIQYLMRRGFALSEIRKEL